MHALGARGFLSKSASVEEMGEAIERVMAGETHFAADIAQASAETPAAAFASLSPAQLEVLGELAAGHANKIIAYNLNLAEPTVKSHLSAIYRALGVSNRSMAILELQKMNQAGLNDPPA